MKFWSTMTPKYLTIFLFVFALVCLFLSLTIFDNLYGVILSVFLIIVSVTIMLRLVFSRSS